MGRPENTFKTPEELAAMPVDKRLKYLENHKQYLKRKASNKRTPSLMNLKRKEKRQEWQDRLQIAWEKFPESTFREWLRTHCPLQGHLRLNCNRWKTEPRAVSLHLQGVRNLEIDAIRLISLDVGVVLEKIMAEFDEIRLKTEETRLANRALRKADKLARETKKLIAQVNEESKTENGTDS